jgi:hypothetical protein
MSTATWMARTGEVSPRFKARIAGGLYVFSLLTAFFLEVFLRGRLGYGVDIIQMLGMAAVTLLCYYIFMAVNKSLSLLGASFNLVGLISEAFRLTPHGVNTAIVFHGAFCILIGYLTFRSAFLPRILGVLMAFAGLSWLTFLLPSLAKYLSPLQPGLRRHWGSIGVPLAPRDGCERPTMEGAAQRARAPRMKVAFTTSL